MKSSLDAFGDHPFYYLMKDSLASAPPIQPTGIFGVFRELLDHPDLKKINLRDEMPESLKGLWDRLPLKSLSDPPSNAVREQNEILSHFMGQIENSSGSEQPGGGDENPGCMPFSRLFQRSKKTELNHEKAGDGAGPPIIKELRMVSIQRGPCKRGALVDRAYPGEVIELIGSGFSKTPSQNIISFGENRAVTLVSGPGRIYVSVPYPGGIDIPTGENPWGFEFPTGPAPIRLKCPSGETTIPFTITSPPKGLPDRFEEGMASIKSGFRHFGNWFERHPETWSTMKAMDEFGVLERFEGNRKSLFGELENSLNLFSDALLLQPPGLKQMVRNHFSIHFSNMTASTGAGDDYPLPDPENPLVPALDFLESVVVWLMELFHIVTALGIVLATSIVAFAITWALLGGISLIVGIFALLVLLLIWINVMILLLAVILVVFVVFLAVWGIAELVGLAMDLFGGDGG